MYSLYGLMHIGRTSRCLSVNYYYQLIIIISIACRRCFAIKIKLLLVLYAIIIPIERAIYCHWKDSRDNFTPNEEHRCQNSTTFS